MNLGGRRGNHRARHVRIAVFDRDVAAAASPHDVPRFETLTGESTLNAWPRERFEQDAVELAEPADRHGPRLGAEGGHDARKQPIAFLPVQARDVERDTRPLSVRRLSLELDERLRRRRPALVELDPFRIHRVDDLAGHRHVSDVHPRIEGAFLLRHRGGRRDLLRRKLARHGLHTGRWLDRYFPVRCFQRPLSKWPLDAVAPGRATGQPDPLGLEEIRQHREIHVSMLDVPGRSSRRVPAIERRHAVIESRRSSIQTGVRSRDLEPIWHPQHRSVEVPESPRVHAGEVAVECAAQIASTFEHPERPGEVSSTRHGEVLGVEEDVLLRGKVDHRGDLIELFRPAAEIEVACDDRAGAVGQQVDSIEANPAPLHVEPRPHSRTKRLIREDADPSVRERRAAPVIVGQVAPVQLHRQIRGNRAPRRAVILEGQLPAVSEHGLERGGQVDPPGLGRFPTLGHQFRQVVPAIGILCRGRKGLEDHLPIRHRHRLDDQLAREDSPPWKLHA